MSPHSAWTVTTATLLACLFSDSNAQTRLEAGKEYKAYSPSYFRPKFRLQYNIYFSPILTVDPLGIGGKSAYSLAIGTRINLWESKTPQKQNSGLKINGWYFGGGYEYFPQQYDKAYVSLWIRIKTFMQFVGRLDGVYSYGYGLTGTGSRYCAGFEVKKVSIFVCGELFNRGYIDHPRLKSKYFNQAAVFLIIPLYSPK